MMSFKSWLLKQKNENTPVGDLARDFSIMKDDVPNTMTFADLKEILVNSGACDGALTALNSAWTQYQQYLSQDA